MKHAFVRPRLVALLLTVVAPLFSSGSARAEVAEARAAVMLRDRPAAAGRVVDRIASGSKLTMIEMSADGAWARVRTKAGKEGWVPVASIRTKGGGGNNGGGGEEEEEAPRGPDDGIAKRRNVRPESWVSKSKYHEEDNKMTVVANKAELYGRPQATGTVLGIVRRGEVVSFVRKSADKKWVQIDIGAGELAWVDARAVRMGSDMPRVGEEAADEPPPTRRPQARREEPDEPPPTARRRESPREEPPPSRTKPQARREEPDEPPPTPSRRPRAEEPSPEDVRRQDRARDDEPPPGAKRRDDDAPPPSRRRVVEEEPAREEAPPPRRRRKSETAKDETPSSRPKKPPHGNNYVDVRVRFGFAKTGEQYRTNGTTSSLLTNYEFNTTNLGVGVQLGYSRAIGKLRINIDGKYLLAAAGVVQYTDAKGAVTRLGILDQNLGGGLGVGGFFDVAGGIDLRLRLGADVWVNQISPSNAPISISSEISLGMTIGLEFAMPEVVYFGGRPLGFRIKGGALVPAKVMQQPNLQTAPGNSSVGGYFGAEIAYGLLTNVKHGQLSLAIGYDLSLSFTHFTGVCPPTILSQNQRVCRDDTVDDANSSAVAHLGTVGLYYQY